MQLRSVGPGLTSRQLVQDLLLKWLLAVVVLLVVQPEAGARRGYVRTRDGRVLEGHLRFESNAVIIVDASRDLLLQVALTNLAAMGFPPETFVRIQNLLRLPAPAARDIK